MKFPWILFDVDDTLFNFKKSAHYSLLRTFEHYKIPAEQSHFDVYKNINHDIWLAFERKEITAIELRKTRFKLFLDAIGEYRDPVEMNTFYLHQLSQGDILLKGAKQLVEDLRNRGHRLALITNGLKEVQRPRIAKAEMGHYFETIVVSDEIGVAKPHAGFFEYAFDKIGNPEKEQVIVVGDSLSSDIQGGNNFGVATCWYNPNENTNLTKHQPTFEISKLETLHEIVQ